MVKNMASVLSILVSNRVYIVLALMSSIGNVSKKPLIFIFTSGFMKMVPKRAFFSRQKLSLKSTI